MVNGSIILPIMFMKILLFSIHCCHSKILYKRPVTVNLILLGRFTSVPMEIIYISMQNTSITFWYPKACRTPWCLGKFKPCFLALEVALGYQSNKKQLLSSSIYFLTPLLSFLEAKKRLIRTIANQAITILALIIIKNFAMAALN